VSRTSHWKAVIPTVFPEPGAARRAVLLPVEASYRRSNDVAGVSAGARPRADIAPASYPKDFWRERAKVGERLAFFARKALLDDTYRFHGFVGLAVTLRIWSTNLRGNSAIQQFS
jgi:hypothetical protein